jgi:hypothetical protein
MRGFLFWSNLGVSGGISSLFVLLNCYTPYIADYFGAEYRGKVGGSDGFDFYRVA